MKEPKHTHAVTLVIAFTLRSTKKGRMGDREAARRAFEVVVGQMGDDVELIHTSAERLHK